MRLLTSVYMNVTLRSADGALLASGNDSDAVRARVNPGYA